MQEMMCPRDGTFAPGSLLELNSHSLYIQRSRDGDTIPPSLVTSLMATRTSDPAQGSSLPGQPSLQKLTS